MAPVPENAPIAHVVTTGSAYRCILRLATPTVLAMLVQSIANYVDIVFFAHLPCPESSNAQAALLPSLILLWGFGGSLSAISVGTQAFVARRCAEQRHADAGAVLVNAATFAAFAGVVFTLVGYAVMPLLLPVMLTVPAVRAAADAYLRWRLLGITSMAMTFAFKAFFDGIGKTHVHLVASVIMNALNIVLCYALIFGNLGAPKMGIEGSGIAGAFSTYVGLAIMIAYAALPSFRDHRVFDRRRISRTITGDILKLSIPSGVATAAVVGGLFLFVAIVARLDAITPAGVVEIACGGVQPVNEAATTDIVAILKLTFTACLAFGTSTATLVSQSLGERDPDKASRFGWASVRLGLLIFGVIGLCEGALFTDPILGILTHSALVQRAAGMPMRIMGICTPLIAVGMILTQALFGAGNTRFVMIVQLVLLFACLVPLAWILGITMNGGLVGIWLAAVAYVALLSSTMIWKFARGDWKRIHL